MTRWWWSRPTCSQCLLLARPVRIVRPAAVPASDTPGVRVAPRPDTT